MALLPEALEQAGSQEVDVVAVKSKLSKNAINVRKTKLFYGLRQR
jgi:hypothetical protein